MEIKEDAEKILNEFSKILETIPDLEETYYITDNLNLTRKDESVSKDSSKILRNAKTDKNGNLIVKKADWTN
ncbi:Asp-tRNA(Asn) amidotransferase subunit GatC [uncultured Methanobrevibacter sp.]|uniref:Asp-tRNA(Asn) amidotransferase subunit GatC n=1 Tax=uncultured Methanobrevibacter sp. TaxID=253161 RepID=UPI0025DC1099|nr:Asp-tRNA(Asn) amidotransferase subunit GatC [uncultured Methanobrevibacter sp.]